MANSTNLLQSPENKNSAYTLTPKTMISIDAKKTCDKFLGVSLRPDGSLVTVECRFTGGSHDLINEHSIIILRILDNEMKEQFSMEYKFDESQGRYPGCWLQVLALRNGNILLRRDSNLCWLLDPTLKKIGEINKFVKLDDGVVEVDKDRIVGLFKEQNRELELGVFNFATNEYKPLPVPKSPKNATLLLRRVIVLPENHIGVIDDLGNIYIFGMKQAKYKIQNMLWELSGIDPSIPQLLQTIHCKDAPKPYVQNGRVIRGVNAGFQQLYCKTDGTLLACRLLDNQIETREFKQNNGQWQLVKGTCVSPLQHIFSYDVSFDGKATIVGYPMRENPPYTRQPGRDLYAFNLETCIQYHIPFDSVAHKIIAQEEGELIVMTSEYWAGGDKRIIRFQLEKEGQRQKQKMFLFKQLYEENTGFFRQTTQFSPAITNLVLDHLTLQDMNMTLRTCPQVRS